MSKSDREERRSSRTPVPSGAPAPVAPVVAAPPPPQAAAEVVPAAPEVPIPAPAPPATVEESVPAPLPESTPFTASIEGPIAISDSVAAAHSALVISGGASKELVKIKMDGTVEFGPDYTPDETARVFWLAMAERHPTRLAPPAPGSQDAMRVLCNLVDALQAAHLPVALNKLRDGLWSPRLGEFDGARPQAADPKPLAAFNAAVAFLKANGL